MKKKIFNLVKSNFIKNVTVMVTGTASAQLITFLLVPIVTRLYGPENFGVMGTFNALIGLVVPLAALTFPIAIVLPKKTKEAAGIAKLSLITSLFISLLVLIVIVLFSEQIVTIFNLEGIELYLYLVPLVIIFSSLMQVFGQWLIRTKQFNTNARVILTESIISNGSKVLIGLFYPTAHVLIFFSGIKNGIKALMMNLLGDLSRLKKGFRERHNIRRLARKYYDFPIYRAPETMISSFSEALPVLFLSMFFGPGSAGFYTLGRSVLSLPANLIGKAVGDVFYPHVAEVANNDKSVYKAIVKATLLLTVLGVIPFGFIILTGPFLFNFIFGAEWVVAGEYARWLALWLFTSFINRPSVRSLAVLNAQKFHLIYTIFMLVSRLSLMWISFNIFNSDLIVIAIYSISGAILNVGLILITLRISRKIDIRNLNN